MLADVSAVGAGRQTRPSDFAEGGPRVPRPARIAREIARDEGFRRAYSIAFIRLIDAPLAYIFNFANLFIQPRKNLFCVEFFATMLK